VVDPLEGTRKVEIALVGDPRQLSPNVYSNQATQAGLRQSFLEQLLLRLVNVLPGQTTTDMLGPDLHTMDELISYSIQEQLSVVLTVNYRGHPSFLFGLSPQDHDVASSSSAPDRNVDKALSSTLERLCRI